jgi:phage gp29-like protein
MKLKAFASDKLASLLAALIPTSRRALVNLRHEPLSIITNATARTIAGAVQLAEQGDTRQLFSIYRDLTLAGSHVQAEFSKRKLAILGQPLSVQAIDKNNADDVLAAKAVRQMIRDCENWIDGLLHLEDSVLWPVAAAEKIFRPVTPLDFNPGELNLRWTLKRIEPVNHTLLCFRSDRWGPQTTERTDGKNFGASSVLKPDVWEEDLRFWNTNEKGEIDYSWDTAYPADPTRHVIHRGHLLTSARDNWGGPMRAIVFWWLLSVLAREWFSRYMERYGSPFILAKTDSGSKPQIDFLREALSLATKLGGLVVDHETEVSLEEAYTTGGALAHETFKNVINEEISKVIVGQTLSADSKATGLGSGVANLQAAVRDDLRLFDAIKLNETLQRQLFTQFLAINGLRGQPPKCVWGGLDPQDAKATSDVVKTLYDAGLEVDDEAIQTISERIGFAVRRRRMTSPGPLAAFGAPALAGPQNPAAQTADTQARARAAALARAFRGSLAPVREIILQSATPAEAEKKLAAFYADWKPEKVHALLEEALQIAAAAGAAHGSQ